MDSQLTPQQLEGLGHAFDRLQAEKLAAQQAAAVVPKRRFRRHPRTGALIEETWVDDAIKGFGSGVAQGFVGLTGLPGELERWGRIGINAAGKKLLNRADAFVDENSYFPTGADMIRKAERYVGPFYQAQTMPGRFFQTLGEFAPGVLIPGGQLRTAAQVGGHVLKNAVIPAVAAQSAYELAPKGKQDQWKAYAGILAGLGTQAPIGIKRQGDNILAASVTPEEVKAFTQGPNRPLFQTSPRTLEIAQEIAVRNPHQGKFLQKSLDELGFETPPRIKDNSIPTFGPDAVGGQRLNKFAPAVIADMVTGSDVMAAIANASATAGITRIWDVLKRGPGRQASLDHELMNRLTLGQGGARRELDRILSWQNSLGYNLHPGVRYTGAGLVALNASGIPRENH